MTLSLKNTFEKNKLGLIFNITKFNVELMDKEQIKSSITFDVSGYSYSGNGTAIISSKLMYDQGDFYLHDIVVDEFKLLRTTNNENIKTTGTNVFSSLKEKLKNKLNNKYLNNDIINKKIDTVTSNKMTFIKDSAINLLHRTMETTPIYSSIKLLLYLIP